MNPIAADPASYLAAMIDGEGHVSAKQNKAIRIGNTEPELIAATEWCCDQLGFHWRTNGPYLKPSGKSVWEVSINGRDTLERALEVLPIQSPRKRAALVEAIGNYKYCRPPTKEWLEQKYVTERLSLSRIVPLCEANNSVTVWGWLRKYGIPTRSRAEGMRKYPRPERGWLVERRAEGMSLKQIAEVTGAPQASTVHNWIKQYGITTKES